MMQVGKLVDSISTRQQQHKDIFLRMAVQGLQVLASGPPADPGSTPAAVAARYAACIFHVWEAVQHDVVGSGSDKTDQAHTYHNA